MLFKFCQLKHSLKLCPRNGEIMALILLKVGYLLCPVGKNLDLAGKKILMRNIALNVLSSFH